jgi:hypothetical protein
MRGTRSSAMRGDGARQSVIFLALGGQRSSLLQEGLSNSIQRACLRRACQGKSRTTKVDRSEMGRGMNWKVPSPRLLPDNSGVVCDTCGQQWIPGVTGPSCVRCAVAWVEKENDMKHTWSFVEKTPDQEHHRCARCGLMRIRYKDGGWKTIYHAEGFVETFQAPTCEVLK